MDLHISGVAGVPSTNERPVVGGDVDGGGGRGEKKAPGLVGGNVGGRPIRVGQVFWNTLHQPQTVCNISYRLLLLSFIVCTCC